MPLFCDTALAERIERAEAQLIAKASSQGRSAPVIWGDGQPLGHAGPPVPAVTGGIRSDQGRADSSWLASRNNVASSP